MKNLSIAVAVIVVLGVGYYIYNIYSQDTSGVTMEKQTTTGTGQNFNFDKAKKSAHYETNTPAHGAILPATPIGVAIDFNFDLGDGSEILIKGPNGSDYSTGDTSISANKLAMRRGMKYDSPDGLYKVEYNACWPDGSCHDGNFQFAIYRSLANDATDMRNKAEVVIDMRDLKFAPEMMRVSRGTQVTWTNSDEAGHYVNTDSHPAHTYYLTQNSKLLKKGQSYSLIFNEPGAYPYHCSAHARGMMGMLIVE